MNDFVMAHIVSKYTFLESTDKQALGWLMKVQFTDLRLDIVELLDGDDFQ